MIETGTKKLVESSMVINKTEDLEEFIKKSQTKSFTSEETGITKEFIKKVIVIFADRESTFMKKSLIGLPVLITKAFSQNITLKMCDIKLEELKKYNEIKIIPTLVVFQTEKIIDVIEGEEDINKIIKSLTIDINKSIEDSIK
ncbi:MAG: hypothetical protein Q9M97_04565 [Candidatus Gracilibacteria bacterium]|nr:hypothetical protein [Candidatus Gracilibacteria bacterium]